MNAVDCAAVYDCQGGGGETTCVQRTDGQQRLKVGPLTEDGATELAGDSLDFGARRTAEAKCTAGQNGIWHDDEHGVGLLDDWLYTPEITIPSNASQVTLSFWERNCFVNRTYYDLHAVYYSTNGNDFTQIVEMDDQADDWELVTIDASALAGENVFFAWRYRGDYATEWFLDDVRVTAEVGTDVTPHADVTIPERFALGTPYPNPFNSTVQIPFELAAPQQLTLSIFNVLGQRVATLVNNEKFEAGAHRMMWNGDAAASGVYLVQLESGDKLDTRKILLVK
jgi:hypothetical protein